MLSSLLKRKLFKVAKENNQKVPINYPQILEKAQSVNHLSDDKIVFSWFCDSGGLSLSASATLKHYIVCNTGWALRLIFYNDESTWNAFRITIGHELTHKDGDYFSFRIRKRDRKFISRVGEVHADFGAAEKMAACSRQKLLDSTRYKKALKKKDKGDFAHPSWERREYYVTNFNFDEKLIRQIARDVGCLNERLIEKITQFYKPIVLK